MVQVTHLIEEYSLLYLLYYQLFLHPLEAFLVVEHVGELLYLLIVLLQLILLGLILVLIGLVQVVVLDLLFGCFTELVAHVVGEKAQVLDLWDAE